MSKRTTSRQSQGYATRRNDQFVIAIAVVASLLTAWAMLAPSGALDSSLRQKGRKKSGAVSLASFNSNSPSKEYIYAGGRLVATEECSYSISPMDAFYSTAGEEGMVNLTAGTGCGWTASSSDPDWLTLTSASSGAGSEPITYIVRDNETGVPRQGRLTIAGLIFTVTQEGVPAGDCTYAISPTFTSFNASGGNGTVSVFTEERCAWQAVSNASWVTVTSGCCGIGNGTVSYSVAPNTTGSGRNGTITIGDKTFTVKQKKP